MFTQQLLHEGSVVTKGKKLFSSVADGFTNFCLFVTVPIGRKYVLRSDIMFAKPTQQNKSGPEWSYCTVS